MRDLISYPPNVAGGLMGAEHYAYSRSARVADFLRDREDALGLVVGERDEHSNLRRPGKCGHAGEEEQ